MNKHLVIGIILLAAGLIIIIFSFVSDAGSGTRLVIRGTNISYGWLLLVLGGIRLFRAKAQN